MKLNVSSHSRLVGQTFPRTLQTSKHLFHFPRWLLMEA